MNFTQLALGEFYLGKYHEYDFDNEELKAPREFRYKTYDDTQFRENQQQRQQGGMTSTYSVSIQTTADFPFKRGDKIELVNKVINGKPLVLSISTVEYVENTPLAMTNIFYTKGNRHPKRLHLNKG